MGSKSTETKSMPQFQQDFLEGTVIPFAQDFLAQPYQSFEGDRVAGMTPLQQQAMTGYGALSMGQPLYSAAADAYGNLATMEAPQIADVGSLAEANLDPYMNPFQDAVIDRSLSRLKEFQDMGLNTVGAKATAAKSFGGSRQGVQEGVTLAKYGDQAKDLITEGNLANFQQAQRAAGIDLKMEQDRAIRNALLEGDAARLRGAGAAGLTNVASSQLRNELAGLGAQTAAGEAQRALSQAELDAVFQDFLAQQGYPLTQFGVLTGTAGAIPQGYGTFTTRTGGLGPALGALGSVGMGFGMAGLGPLQGLQGVQGGIGFNPFSGLG